MEKRADLHIHSIYSDGVLPPEEIFEKARKYGLKGISITDHDTIDGCINAEALKDDFDIEFITGVELSCFENGNEYHILGYLIDLDNQQLRRHLAEYRKVRLFRAKRIVDKLLMNDIHLTLDEILDKAGDAPVTRPHIASVMTDKGFTATLKEAFVHYLGEGKPAYEEKAHFSVKDGIKLINNAGGVAVIAHPGKYISQEALFRFIEAGLDGIEVNHPHHDRSMKRHYHNLASQYWLLETGGSDYHGNRDYDEVNFGKSTVSYSVIEKIKKQALNYNK